MNLVMRFFSYLRRILGNLAYRVYFGLLRATRYLGQVFYRSKEVLSGFSRNMYEGLLLFTRCLGQFFSWFGGVSRSLPKKMWSGVHWLILSQRREIRNWRLAILSAVSLGLFLGLCLRDMMEPKLPIQGFSCRSFLVFKLSIAVVLSILLLQFGALFLSPLRMRSSFALAYELSNEFQACADSYANVSDRSHARGELTQAYRTMKYRLIFTHIPLFALAYGCLVVLFASAWFLCTAYSGCENCPVLAGDSCNAHMGMLDHVYFTLVTLATIGYGDIHPTNHTGFWLGIGTIVVGIFIYGATFTAFVNFWPTKIRKMDTEIHGQISDFCAGAAGLNQLLD